MSAGTLTETFPAAPPESASQQRVSEPFLSDPARISRFLGWFSIGLGAAELLAPRAIARISGTRNHGGVTRLYGMREIAAGVGIFTHPNPAPWLWARVAGDVLDLASIVGGSTKGRRVATVGSLAAVAGVTALDVLCAQKLSTKARETPSTERAEASVLIASSPDECYRYWRKLENHPRFINELASVRVSGDRMSHWIFQLPGNHRQVEWDAEITEDIPGERISWRGIPKSGIEASGTVTFEVAAGNRGTIVRVQLDFDHPGRSFLSPAARALGKHPEQILYKSLRRLKSLLEVGDILETQGQSAGRRSGATWLDQIAR